MARITPYHKPAIQPDLETYVPLPFEDYLKAGAAKQKRWDDTEALMEAPYEALKDLDIRYFDVDAYEGRMGAIRQGLDEIYDLGVDITSSKFKRQFNETIRPMYTSQYFRNYVLNAKTYDAMKEQQRAAKAAGTEIWDRWEMDKDIEFLEKHGTEGWMAKNNGASFDPAGWKKSENWRNPMEESVNGMGWINSSTKTLSDDMLYELGSGHGERPVLKILGALGLTTDNVIVDLKTGEVTIGDLEFIGASIPNNIISTSGGQSLMNYGRYTSEKNHGVQDAGLKYSEEAYKEAAKSLVYEYFANSIEESLSLSPLGTETGIKKLNEDIVSATWTTSGLSTQSGGDGTIGGWNKQYDEIHKNYTTTYSAFRSNLTNAVNFMQNNGVPLSDEAKDAWKRIQIADMTPGVEFDKADLDLVISDLNSASEVLPFDVSTDFMMQYNNAISARRALDNELTKRQNMFKGVLDDLTPTEMLQLQIQSSLTLESGYKPYGQMNATEQNKLKDRIADAYAHNTQYLVDPNIPNARKLELGYLNSDILDKHTKKLQRENTLYTLSFTGGNNINPTIETLTELAQKPDNNLFVYANNDVSTAGTAVPLSDIYEDGKYDPSKTTLQYVKNGQGEHMWALNLMPVENPTSNTMIDPFGWWLPKPMQILVNFNDEAKSGGPTNAFMGAITKEWNKIESSGTADENTMRTKKNLALVSGNDHYGSAVKSSDIDFLTVYDDENNLGNNYIEFGPVQMLGSNGITQVNSAKIYRVKTDDKGIGTEYGFIVMLGGVPMSNEYGSSIYFTDAEDIRATLGNFSCRIAGALGINNIDLYSGKL